MNSTDIRDWQSIPQGSWSDSPATSTWADEIPEWEASLLLPQLVSTLEHPAGPTQGVTPAPSSRLLSLWRQLRASARRTFALHRVLQVH